VYRDQDADNDGYPSGFFGSVGNLGSIHVNTGCARPNRQHVSDAGRDFHHRSVGGVAAAALAVVRVSVPCLPDWLVAD
jgi:hypothetical protein